MVKRGASSAAAEPRGKEAKVTGASTSTRTTRTINLKGQTLGTVVGRCVTVLYDEGGGKPQPYEGVVVYAEPGR